MPTTAVTKASQESPRDDSGAWSGVEGQKRPGRVAADEAEALADELG